ncbi:hemerythrin domain-containing protein [Candidatus Neomarinimicrobiota bacterium]
MTDRPEVSNLRGGGRKELLRSLPESHVLHTITQEHEHITGFLRELDTQRNQLVQKATLNESRSILDDIRHSAELLLDTESHHIREEEVVCLELERMHISGPAETLRREHNLLRPLKRRLLDLTTIGSEKMEFNTLQAEINGVIDRVICNYLLHMQKEDDILFPLVLENIDDAAIWERMRIQCDEIGYCSFTPGAGIYRL